MAEHPRHSTPNKGDPARTDEHADRVEPALVQLVRLLGRHAAQELLNANRATPEQAATRELPDDA